VTWTNAISLTSGPAIDRSQPLTITWTGGDANGFVDIVGSAQLGPAGSPTYSITFDCAAPTTAGQFTIPPEIMLGMPTGASAIAAIQVSTFAYPFISGTVSGLDAVQNLTKLQAVAPVIFK
jgi:hypothetical protein